MSFRHMSFRTPLSFRTGLSFQTSFVIPNRSISLTYMTFTEDLPEGRAKAGVAGQFASSINSTIFPQNSITGWKPYNSKDRINQISIVGTVL